MLRQGVLATYPGQRQQVTAVCIARCKKAWYVCCRYLPSAATTPHPSLDPSTPSP
jgi:hypothetical protein